MCARGVKNEFVMTVIGNVSTANRLNAVSASKTYVQTVLNGSVKNVSKNATAVSQRATAPTICTVVFAMSVKVVFVKCVVPFAAEVDAKMSFV